MNMPLLAERELIGSLNLEAERPFSSEHIEIAREVANSLAVAIRHARLNAQVARHAAELEKRVINDRKQAEEQLEHLTRQNVYLQQEIQSEFNFEEILGASPSMQKVFE